MSGQASLQVVGVTTQQYIYVASRERKFRMNEILVILDKEHGYPKGEVIETQSFNRFIPLATEKNSLVDDNVLNGLRQVGFNLEDEEINLAKVRLLTELSYPVKTGTKARLPAFHEVEHILVKRGPDEGLVIGVMKGTEEIASGIPDALQNIAYLYNKDEGIVPQNGVPFIFDYKAMHEYPHIGIFGGSGSGKSFGMRVLLEELQKKQIPGIVFDPHYEMDFKAPFKGIPDEYKDDFTRTSVLFTAGQGIGIRFEELSAADLIKLLRAVGGQFSEPMENAVQTLYRKKDSFLTFSTRLENLIQAMDNERLIRRRIEEPELEREERERMQEQIELLEQFGSKVGHVGTLRGVAWRLNALYQTGLFSYDITPIEEALKARKMVIIRGQIKHLQIFAAYLLTKLYGLRREYRDSINIGKDIKEAFPPFIVCTDEAHNFAPAGVDAPAKSILREIAQEGRKYGVFLVLATQRPALLDETITAQLNTKFVFRTVRSSDIKLIREETDITSSEAERLPYLNSGDAFISSAIIGRTVFVRIRLAKTITEHADNPFDELEQMSAKAQDKLYEAVRDLLPLAEVNFNSELDNICKRIGKRLSYRELIDSLYGLVAQGKIDVEETMFGIRFVEKVS